MYSLFFRSASFATPGLRAFSLRATQSIRRAQDGAVKREVSHFQHSDGRTSLKKHLTEREASLAQELSRNAGKRELLPLFACIGAGVLGCGWFMFRGP